MAKIRHKSFRVTPDQEHSLKNKAYKLGYVYNGHGSISLLLQAIAKGEVKLTKEI